MEDGAPVVGLQMGLFFLLDGALMIVDRRRASPVIEAPG